MGSRAADLNALLPCGSTDLLGISLMPKSDEAAFNSLRNQFSGKLAQPMFNSVLRMTAQLLDVVSAEVAKGQAGETRDEIATFIRERAINTRGLQQSGSTEELRLKDEHQAAVT
jgi:hypothetical protein